MAKGYFPKRIDSNQDAIVNDLRRLGASVKSLHEVGGGVPDLLCAFAGANYLIELKFLKGKLNERQERFHRSWNGPIYTCRTLEECCVVMGISIS